MIQQFTTDQFLRGSEERVRTREEQLRRFNLAVSHELKNHIAAASGALAILGEASVFVDEANRERFLSIASANVASMGETLHRLIELSRLDPEPRPIRNRLLPDVAAEVKRQLRDFAAARGVRVELASDLPWVEVPAAVVELVLSNYVSNAVKYGDPEREDRWVRIYGEVRHSTTQPELLVRVRDNGLGVPEEARDRLFERYFRAQRDVAAGVEGSGLGLALVREVLEGVHGRGWAEFPLEGTVFAFSIPSLGGSTPQAMNGATAPSSASTG